MFSAYPVMVFPFWFCSKSSLLLGLSLTVPLMVACLSIAIPIWIRNGYQFWVSRTDGACPEGNHRTPGMKEVCYFPVPLFLLLSVSGCLSLYRVMRCYFLLLFTTTIIAIVDMEMLSFACGVYLVLPWVSVICVLVLSCQKVHHANPDLVYNEL